MAERCTTTKFNSKTHKPEERLDNDLFYKQLFIMSNSMKNDKHTNDMTCLLANRSVKIIQKTNIT